MSRARDESIVTRRRNEISINPLKADYILQLFCYVIIRFSLGRARFAIRAHYSRASRFALVKISQRARCFCEEESESTRAALSDDPVLRASLINSALLRAGGSESILERLDAAAARGCGGMGGSGEDGLSACT